MSENRDLYCWDLERGIYIVGVVILKRAWASYEFKRTLPWHKKGSKNLRVMVP